MARIRCIKPEFWTDEKIVSLPFEARLLFIGLWNFCDDSGSVEDSPDRLHMQVFPGDPDLKIDALLDLLCAVGLVERWVRDGSSVLSIPNWTKHQKIDNPSRKTISREGYRKLAIPGSARIAVAKKYSCSPGETADAQCFYCGAAGKIHWYTGARGRPTQWVVLVDLEFDHFRAEIGGGPNDGTNIVLACRPCNRGKREFDAKQFFEIKNPRVALASPIEDSALDGKGLDLVGRKEGRSDPPSEPQSRVTGRDGDALRRCLSDLGVLGRASSKTLAAVLARLLEVGWTPDTVREAFAAMDGKTEKQRASQLGSLLLDDERFERFNDDACRRASELRYRTGK